jgi:hypothetical protein
MHSPPFALSLSKRSWRTQGFDRLSPTLRQAQGERVGFDRLSPNGVGRELA